MPRAHQKKRRAPSSWPLARRADNEIARRLHGRSHGGGFRAHDSIAFHEVYEKAAESGRVARVIADKAYDGAPIRDALVADGVKISIPSPKNRRRKSRCLRRFYRQRHKVENYFRKLFDFRRVATRYDKLAQCYLAFVHMAAVVVLLRQFVNTP
jgi:transposase